MFTHMGNFFIDQWLWNVTWDWYHIPLTIFFMILLLKFFLRINIISSVLMAVSSTLVAFITYTFLVVGVLMPVFKYGQMPNQELLPQPWQAYLYLAVIYMTLQTLFFIILNYYYPLQRTKVSLVAVVANVLAAGIIYLVLPNPFL